MNRKWHTKINKAIGTNVVRRGTEVQDILRIPTGSFSLDVELGGGIPIGMMSLLIGADQDGKTATTLKTAGEFQKLWPDKEIVWIDAEGKWQADWCVALGLNPEEVTLVTPRHQQEAFDICEQAVMHDVGLIVIDSIAALVPKEEAEADMEQVLPGLQSRLNSKFMRKAQSALNDPQAEGDIPATMIILNQMREKIGGYGNPETMPGGRALKHYTSVRIRLRKGDYYPASKSVKDEGVEPKAQAIKFHTEKNQTAPAQRRGHFWFYFDTLDQYRTKGSIDRLEEIIRYGMKYNLIQRPSNSMYEIPDPETGELVKHRGSNALAAYIRENKKTWKWLEEKVMNIAQGKEALPENEQGEGTNDTEGDTEGGREE